MPPESTSDTAVTVLESATPEVSRGTVALRWISAHASRIVLGLVLLVAAVLRFWDLGRLGLWFDELFTVAETSHGPVFAVQKIMADLQPPLYFVMQSLFVPIFGRSEWAMRVLPAIAGVATTGVLFLLGKRMFSERAGLWVAALFAVSPLAIKYAQEARGNSLLILMSALVLLAFINLAYKPDTRRAIMLGAAIAGLAYTHVYGYLAVPLLLVVVLVRPKLRMELGRLVAIAYGVAAALFLPWAFFIPAQVRIVTRMSARGGWWLDSQRPASVIQSLLDTLTAFSSPEHFAVGIGFVLLMVVGVVGAFDLGLPGTGYSPSAAETTENEPISEVDIIWVLVAFAVVPILTGLLISKYVVVVHNLRSCLGALPAVFLLVVRGGQRLPRRLGELALLALLVAAIAGIPGYFQETFTKGSWREAAARVLQYQTPQTAVLADGYPPVVDLTVYADILGREGAIKPAQVVAGGSGETTIVVQAYGASKSTALALYLAPYDRVIAASLKPSNVVFDYLDGQGAWHRTDSWLRADTNVVTWEKDQ